MYKKEPDLFLPCCTTWKKAINQLPPPATPLHCLLTPLTQLPREVTIKLIHTYNDAKKRKRKKKLREIVGERDDRESVASYCILRSLDSFMRDLMPRTKEKV